jgi:4-amino-4-deoxy-L-arabinose transferase-like glycosyltransferase
MRAYGFFRDPMQEHSNLPQPLTSSQASSAGAVSTRGGRLASVLSLNAPSLQPLVLLILGLNLLFWVALPSLLLTGPDADNMEELVWGNVFQWGYYKHPPLPSWVHFTLMSVFGRHIWITFFAAQLSVALALYFIWRLGCELTSQRNALLAVVLTMPIAYFTTRGVMSNHNTLQLWSVAGSIWMLYRAWRYRQLRDWVLLGMFAGFATLTKYSIAVWYLIFVLHLALSGSLRDARTWKGMLAGTALLVAMVMPHAMWLYHMKFVLHDPANPLDYAAGSADVSTMTRAENLLDMWYVLTTTLARLAPMLLAMLVIGGLMRRARRKQIVPAYSARGSIAAHLRPEDRRFILLLALAPFILTCAMSFVAGTRMIADWTTTYFLMTGLLTFWLYRENSDPRLFKAALVTVLVIQFLTAAGYAVGRGPLASVLGKPGRSNYPSQAVAQAMKHAWYSHTHAPLHFITADTWLGGNIAIHAGRQAQVLINGDLHDSPWVDPEQLKACGTLVAIDISPNAPDGVAPKVAAAMKEAAVTGIVSLPATMDPNGPQITLKWGVVPPTGGCWSISRARRW